MEVIPTVRSLPQWTRFCGGQLYILQRSDNRRALLFDGESIKYLVYFLTPCSTPLELRGLVFFSSHPQPLILRM
jgi:hypothetical protein